MILDKLKDAIRKYELIKRGDLVLVAVSGGTDSVCLLYLLQDLSRLLGFKLQVAHLDHMLRKGSAKDSEFVRRLGVKLGIPVVIGKVNVRRLAKKGSLEEIARNARLMFLLKVAKGIKADKIALAHNLDDQAETVLMRILRGTGLYGLAGILPKRKLYGFTVIRPLIRVQRREIEAFLKRKKIKPRIDRTNFQDTYFRNKLRNKLIPLLKEQYNPRIKDVLSNMAEGIAFDYDYLNRQALRLARGKRNRINTAKFLKLHPSMQRLILRLHISRLQGSTRRITFRHIKEIEDLIVNRPINSIVDLPKGIVVLKKAKSILFYCRYASTSC
ncbi:MAG: tRNA lysidine(34) synthetase TilS [Candidatus Omnitrophica bacterium]|nr:tRNA lysidine(34) synthetase TilS [Candidatus Omnitrophota bacterium]MDD5027361.1 tRNA lysidine(34) synthetase TilS [Candidatus Omnitrophota bacterium]MDD5661830.1 tRNA lysidine(34) synthetase TilS [Candidatus Omnitrophota bacterium]